MKNKFPKNEVFELLADVEHERWASWQKWIMENSFKIEDYGDEIIQLTIPRAYWENWERQIKTPYTKLTEKEKDSDREQVMRYWNLIK